MRLKIHSQNMARDLDRIRRQLPSLAVSAHQEFVRVTPRDTGNAQRSTVRRSNVISAAYNYANRLNAGWSSQAAKGMTDPTVQYLRKLVRKLLGER